MRISDWSSDVCSSDLPAWKRLDEFLKARLQHLEPVLAGREWLAETFFVADILMADVLRLADRFDELAGYPARRAYAVHAPRSEARRVGKGCGSTCRSRWEPVH